MKITLKYPGSVGDLTVSTIMGAYGGIFNSAVVANGMTAAIWTVPSDHCLEALKHQEGVEAHAEQSEEGHEGVQREQTSLGVKDRAESEEPEASDSHRPFGGSSGAAKRKKW
jgi:hypothetical protein